MERWQAERVRSAKDELIKFIAKSEAEMEAISRRMNHAYAVLAMLGDIHDPDTVRRARRRKP